ncbi:MAG: hypothetical protein DMF72_20065 [Acidobacteria bacterium]|nr:MAG: hypothetical protein DMF72_20065 [Acidobacteriota bacterium]
MQRQGNCSRCALNADKDVRAPQAWMPALPAGKENCKNCKAKKAKGAKARELFALRAQCGQGCPRSAGMDARAPSEGRELQIEN